jgi:hypothetical protein
MVFRFLRRPQHPVPEAPPAPLSRPSWFLAPLLALSRGALGLLGLLDRGLVAFALPFGVVIRDPRRRYPVLLGMYAFLYVLALLPIPHLPLAALAVAYLGVLAIGRAWVLNEKKRTAIVKKLEDADPDALPDLRGTALVSALQLVVIFPLLFMQVQRHFHLYRVHGDVPLVDWFWFTVDKTYLKALPDWSVLYGVHISAIEFDAPWGRHLVLLARLTVDYILIQGLLRLLAIRATVGEAVAALKADPEIAVRLGKRAVGPLLAKLHDPDRAVRGAAANALTQLGNESAIQAVFAGAAKPGAASTPEAKG